jgi:hypothetical protein
VVREASSQQSCMARADNLPLVVSVSNAPQLARGSKIVLSLGTADLINIDISASFKSVCATANDEALPAPLEDEAEDDPTPAIPTLVLEEPSEEAPASALPAPR